MTDTGFVFHESYLWHDTGSAGLYLPSGGFVQPDQHVEGPEAKRRIKNLMEVSGLIDLVRPIRPRAATREEALRFHTSAYIDKLEAKNRERGGKAGPETYFSQGGYDIALLAAGGVITAAEAVMDGKVQNAYALTRPPGHHAEATHGYGFCILANIVLAIKHLQATRDIQRVAVVDYDVHHGNGTEHAFYSDPSVLTISIHQDKCFPTDSGAVEDIGDGKGKGFNINVPLPPGSGHGAYLSVLDRVIVPALQAYRPDLIIVASGFDACGFDPLGRMLLSSRSYVELTKGLKQLADDLCSGRLLYAHEGGYSAVYAPFCAHAVIEELCEAPHRIEDPFEAVLASMGGQQLYPHQADVIDKAAAVAKWIK